MKKIQSVEELEEVISRNSNVIIYGAGGVERRLQRSYC